MGSIQRLLLAKLSQFSLVALQIVEATNMLLLLLGVDVLDWMVGATCMRADSMVTLV